MAGPGKVETNGQRPAGWLTAPLPPINPERLAWLLLAVGFALRVHAYAENRYLYRDEASLLENLVRLPVFDFHTTLTENQLAPPGFLVLERLMVRLPLDHRLAGRFFPLVFGIVSLFLFRVAARRFLLPHAVPIAMGLFAMSDWLVYYSSEMKQYSCDLALTLAAFLLATGPVLRGSSGPPAPSEARGSAPLSGRRLLGLGVFGAVGVWFSYPLVFVLAAVGTWLLVEAALRRDVRGAFSLAAIGLAWLASFYVCYRISHGILDRSRFIWDWWDFAFLPLPPRSMADVRYDFWHIVNIFDSPADIKTPLGPVGTAYLALALSVAGSVCMLRRTPGRLYLLIAPAAFVLAASAMHQYPFHGRLLIFLVPSVQILVSQGAGAVTRPGGPWLTVVLGAFLLAQPAIDVVWHQTMTPLHHEGFDSHGDLRPDLLDYLDRLEEQRPVR